MPPPRRLTRTPAARRADPFAGEEHAPDGWIVKHNRMTDSVTFGPFATWDEALDFLDANDDVHGYLVPCWLTVDWNRR